MQRRGGSATAGIVCLARDLAGVDPYAATVLSRLKGFGWARPLMAMRRLPDRLLSLGSGGLVSTIGGRTRFIDTHVMAALEGGATQLVLLGAGFDARPWRLADALGGRPVFLVDHPASAATRAYATATLPHRADVRVDVDFAQDDLAARLCAAGFDASQPAAVVWEGVSMYLPEAAVRHTLATLGRLLASGSQLSFDLWSPSQGLAAITESIGRVGLKWLGEPLDFACPVEAIPGLLRPAGFRATWVTSAADAAIAFGGAGLRGLTYVQAVRGASRTN